MEINWRNRFESIDPFGMLLSLSAPILGILLAVADYHVAWTTASSLVLTVILMHIYMSVGNRLSLALSVAGAFLTVYLSYGSILLLESLLLLLFAYFVMRMAKGMGGRGRIIDGILACVLKGPVALIGAYFVCTHSFPYWFFLFPSFSVGLLCVASDGAIDSYGITTKNLLIYIGISLMVTYSCLRIFAPIHFLFLITLPAFIFITVRMYMSKEQDTGTYGPALALCTFVFAVLTGAGFVGYLF